jgi:polar amino acid transport system substrate-binding protein
MVKRSALLAVIGAGIGLAAAAMAACGGNTAPKSATSGGGSADDLLADVKRRGVLLISTDANYKPQSFRNPDGTWVGFDIDVARAIAKRLGVRPMFVTPAFDQVTAGNWNGRWDVNVDSMAITPGRAKVLWFTRPYYYVPASFAVHKNSTVKTIADIAGKKIGVGTATTYEQYLEGGLNAARVAPPSKTVVVPYETDALALQDLALGNGARLDGVLTALPTIRSAIAAGLQLRVVEPPVFDDSSAIAIDRSSPLNSRPLLTAIDAIVDDMHRDGTLRRLSLKYYGLDLSVRR